MRIRPERQTTVGKTTEAITAEAFGRYTCARARPTDRWRATQGNSSCRHMGTPSTASFLQQNNDIGDYIERLPIAIRKHPPIPAHCRTTRHQDLVHPTRSMT